MPEKVLNSTAEEEKSYCRSFYGNLLPKISLYFKNPSVSSVWEEYTEEEVRDMMLEFMEFGYDECFEGVEKLNKKSSFTINLKDYIVSWTTPLH